MSNPTSNFGWQMPTNTDLVTDLPADFEVFGQAVDSSMADLKGGTTGQILSKNSNTDMDFIWIANDQGDITGVTATSPLTGGGTSGAITVGIQASSTTQSGAVQLTDSTSSTSTTTAATPNSVKTAYDTAASAQTTANAAIPKSTVTTAGDVIYATGSSTVTRLGIGSAGQVLTVSGGAPAWTTPSVASSGLNLISKTTISAATTTNLDGVFTSTYRNYKLILVGTSTTQDYFNFRFRTSGSTNSNANYQMYLNRWNGTNAIQNNQTAILSSSGGALAGMVEMDIFNPQTANRTQWWETAQGWQTTAAYDFRGYLGFFDATTQFDGISFYMGSGTFTGNLYIYGYGE